jgi:hypothetical protein
MDYLFCFAQRPVAFAQGQSRIAMFNTALKNLNPLRAALFFFAGFA